MSNPQPTRGNREAGGDSAAALAQYNETVVLAQLLQSPPLDDAVRWLDCPNPQLDNQTPAAFIRAGRKAAGLKLLEPGAPT